MDKEMFEPLTEQECENLDWIERKIKQELEQRTVIEEIMFTQSKCVANLGNE